MNNKEIKKIKIKSRRLMSKIDTHMRGNSVIRGNAYDTKICYNCGEEKNISFYNVTNTDSYGRLYTKRECDICISNKDKVLFKLRKKYSLTKTNQCMICDKETDLQLDHCHETNVFRGWLCVNCNVGLGRFDTAELLIKALEYTQKDPILEPEDLQLKINF